MSYTAETKFKRMEAARVKAQNYQDKAARLAQEREKALAAAAEWQEQWEWLNDMPIAAAPATAAVEEE